MLRTIALSAALLAATVAFGGVLTPHLDPTENAAAECGQIALKDDPCPPSVGCTISHVINKATDLETACTM